MCHSVLGAKDTTGKKMDVVPGIRELISSTGAATEEIIAEINGHHKSTGCCASELQRKLIHSGNAALKKGYLK